MSDLTYCPIKNSECKVQRPLSPGLTCFLAIPYKEEWKDTRETIRKVLKKLQIFPYVADEDITAGRDILCKICEKITNSDFGVIEVSTINPNVMFEFGLTLGRRKPVFIIFNKALSEKEHLIPTDIVALERIEYRNQGTLEKKLTEGFQQFLSRLDLRQKRCYVMMELARSNAADGDFSTTASLLETIGLSLARQGKLNGDFVQLLEDVVKLSGKDVDTQLGFALALVKFSALTSKEELANSYLDFIFQKLVSCSKAALQSGKVEPKLVKSVITQAEKGRLFTRGFNSLRFEMERQNTFTLYAWCWRILSKVSDKKKFLESLDKYASSYIDRQFGPLMIWRGILYERAERAIKYAGWIHSVAEFEGDKKVRSFAKNLSADLDKILKDYYSTYKKQSKIFVSRAVRKRGI